MEKKRNIGTLLTVIFIVVTAVLFCCDRRTEDADGWLTGAERETPSTETPAADSGMPVPAETAETAEALTEAARIYVYVCGQVKEPDVYELAAGARVYEAVEAAGGTVDGADTNSLNLADVLTDGEKIYVPAQGETAGVSEQPEEKASDGRVNINTATAQELQTLPGIGEAKANAIIAYREANGAFGSIEELREVPGIKDGVFGQIQALIRVD